MRVNDTNQICQMQQTLQPNSNQKLAHFAKNQTTAMNKENEGHIASTNNSKAVFDLPSEDAIQHQQ